MDLGSCPKTEAKECRCGKTEKKNFSKWLKHTNYWVR